MNTDYLFTSNRLGFRNWLALATEGAKACLEYADKHLNLPQIFSIASQLNENSIKVMDKIGMRYLRNFEHPNLIEHPKLKNCVVYLKRF